MLSRLRVLIGLLADTRRYVARVLAERNCRLRPTAVDFSGKRERGWPEALPAPRSCATLSRNRVPRRGTKRLRRDVRVRAATGRCGNTTTPDPVPRQVPRLRSWPVIVDDSNDSDDSVNDVGKGLADNVVAGGFDRRRQCLRFCDRARTMPQTRLCGRRCDGTCRAGRLPEGLFIRSGAASVRSGRQKPIRQLPSPATCEARSRCPERHHNEPCRAWATTRLREVRSGESGVD